MIRIIRCLTAPLLAHLGSAVIHAAHAESDRGDAATRDLYHEQGRNAELRSLLTAERQALESLREDHGIELDRVRDLSSEVERLREIEHNGLADDEVHTFTAQALEEVKAERDSLDAKLREEVERNYQAARSASALRVDLADAQKQRDGYRDAARETQADLDAARVEIVRLGGAAFFAAVTVEPCAWCLGPSDPRSTTHARGNVPAIHYCEAHGDCYGDPSYENTVARVATRAASCESRRTSADPLTIDCPTCKRKAAFDCHPMHVDVNA